MTVTPGGAMEILAVLGKEEALRRLTARPSKDRERIKLRGINLILWKGMDKL